ncbi:flavodoxin domain-containing protein [Chloroflexota bacterium]
MPRAILIYETSSGYTEKMANAIVEGMEEAGVEVLVRRTMKMNMDELAGADALVLGSPTYNNTLIMPMQTLLSKMEGVDLKGKIGAAFGSYGSTGEAVQMMTDSMKNTFGMDVVEPGLRQLTGWDGDRLQECREFGKKIAEKINSCGGRL